MQLRARGRLAEKLAKQQAGYKSYNCISYVEMESALDEHDFLD